MPQYGFILVCYELKYQCFEELLRCDVHNNIRDRIFYIKYINPLESQHQSNIATIFGLAYLFKDGRGLVGLHLFLFWSILSSSYQIARFQIVFRATPNTFRLVHHMIETHPRSLLHHTFFWVFVPICKYRNENLVRRKGKEDVMTLNAIYTYNKKILLPVWMLITCHEVE